MREKSNLTKVENMGEKNYLLCFKVFVQYKKSIVGCEIQSNKA